MIDESVATNSSIFSTDLNVRTIISHDVQMPNCLPVESVRPYHLKPGTPAAVPAVLSSAAC